MSMPIATSKPAMYKLRPGAPDDGSSMMSSAFDCTSWERNRRKLRPSSVIGSTLAKPLPVTNPWGSSSSTSKTTAPPSARMDSGKLLVGTLYENATCLIPGAIGAYTDTRPGPATNASGEISPSLARTSSADAGMETLHVGIGDVVSVATSVRRLSLDSSKTSMTVRNCVVSAFPTIRCRPLTAS